MTFIFRFTLASLLMVCLADLVPYPTLAPGFIAVTLSQKQSTR